MADWFISDWKSVASITLTTLGVFLAVLVVIRFNGLRTLSKMSSFDFAVTVAIGSLIAATAVSNTPSLVEGIVALVALVLCQRAVAIIRVHQSFAAVVGNTPRLLMTGSTMHHKTMREVRVTPDDLVAKLREANVTHLDQVLAVVIETTGDISVLHSDANHELDNRLLQGVDS